MIYTKIPHKNIRTKFFDQGEKTNGLSQGQNLNMIKIMDWKLCKK